MLVDATGFGDFGDAFGTASLSKLWGVVLREGDVVEELQSAGGGGFGDLLEREPALGLADVPAAPSVLGECGAELDGVVLTAAGGVVHAEALDRRPPAATMVDEWPSGER